MRNLSLDKMWTEFSWFRTALSKEFFFEGGGVIVIQHQISKEVWTILTSSEK